MHLTTTFLALIAVASTSPLPPDLIRDPEDISDLVKRDTVYPEERDQSDTLPEIPGDYVEDTTTSAPEELDDVPPEAPQTDEGSVPEDTVGGEPTPEDNPVPQEPVPEESFPEEEPVDSVIDGKNKVEDDFRRV